ncbi:MAG: hypothetical protein C0597_05050 [Marinilabiliales bacterium]|nr:MAG: hypothetical protein C0597_05050 [Marinilabiliales bacterium]
MLKEKNWRQCNCYSKTGISFVYVNYDNPKVVGSSYNIIGFAEPYLYRKKNFSFSARMGVGISLLDHIYDVETNPTNTFFSTTLSYIIHVDLNAYFKLNESYSIMSYAKYNHISNGGVKQPNYGMNFPMFGVGLNYYPSGKNDFPDREKKEFSDEWFYHVYAFGMLKKIEDDPPFDEVTKINFGFLGITGRTVSLLNGFSVGLEYFYDAGAKEEIERKGINDDFNKISGLIGHHLLFGKFDFSQYWGTYIYAPYKPATFYQRYSLSYRIFPWAIAGVTLKAHGDVADSFQVILGLAI